MQTVMVSVLGVGLAAIASFSTAWATVSQFEGTKLRGDRLAVVLVGECPDGLKKVDDGNACDVNAQVCDVTTTSVQISLMPFGVGITFTVDIPTGCDENDLQKPRCLPKVKYTTGAPDETDDGVINIFNKSCTDGQLLKYKQCREIPRNEPFVVPIPPEVVEHANDVVEAICDKMHDLGLVEDCDNVTLFEGNKLKITIPMKKCEAYGEHDYSCGSYKGDVHTCAGS